MKGGYQGRILKIDLSSGVSDSIPVTQELAEQYIGGKGFGARFLYDMAGREVDPLAPANPLMFMPGPLTGTLAPSMREAIVFKSPLTGIYADSFHGGVLGPEIKYCGYDGLIITGKANAPAYIFLDGDKVEIRDARFLWGADTSVTYERLYQVLGDRTVKIACIGPAGENLVRFALIDCTPHRQAGRCGAGAVMGSKNLKALVVRGGAHQVRIADTAKFLELVKATHQRIKQWPGFHELGTLRDVIGHSTAGVIPTFNAQRAAFAGSHRIAGPLHRERIWLRHTACMGCVTACSKVGALRRGPHKGTVVENIEYESLALMGANLGIDHLEGLAYACHLCDLYGLDTMSAGGVIGFAMEAVQRGDLPPAQLDGLDLRFGAYKEVHRLLGMIARREGIGDLLAEGVRRAAQAVGGESYKYALHTKGLEMPGYDPRGLPGQGLGYMTGDKGGEHVQGYMPDFEYRGYPWRGGGREVERFALEGKAEIVIWLQNYQVGTNTLVKCDFVKRYAEDGGSPTPSELAEFLSAATGRAISSADIEWVGERIWNLVRLYNLREGITRQDDELPYRIREEELQDPPAEGRKLSQQDLDRMLDEYYRLRGWSADGVPGLPKLAELGLAKEGQDLGVT
jgi:aldehyde:ferredoxin oxidoreductase